MRVHSERKLKYLIELRKTGLSIDQLVERLLIPKSTVWHHVHAISLSSDQRKRLDSQKGGSKKRQMESLRSAQNTANLFLKGKNRELVIMLAMLYWAEGSKRACEFINSDGRMIALYLHILRKIFKVPEPSIQPTMRIFSGMNKQVCLAYWSSITSIPKSRFIVRFNDGGKRGKTKYGMCRITIKKGGFSLKVIYALRDLLIKEILV